MRRRSAGGSSSRSLETVNGAYTAAMILPGDLPKQIEERCAGLGEMRFELHRAVALPARPRLFTVLIPAVLARVSILHAHQLEIFLPVRPLLFQRGGAEAALDPADGAVVAQPRVGHV